MGILMGALSPHPPLIIPEIGGDKRREIKSTINGLESISREIKELNPEILITISPHGPVFSDAISIIDNEEVEGDFRDFGFPEIKFKEKTNLNFIDKLKNNALNVDVEVVSLNLENMNNLNYNFSLDHGVLVPLFFLKKTGLDVPIIPLTMGLLEYKMLYKFGKVIQDTLNDMNMDAVIIASGDLSHRLKPGAPAGFNPRGREFDRKLLELLEDEDYEGVLKLESGLVDKAGECGLRPLIILLGSLSGLKCKSEVKSYEGPFGVGYAVVGFYPS
jgi:MEMO1 family protein